MPSCHYRFAVFALLCLLLPLPAAAQTEQQQQEQARQVFQSLAQQTGQITLKGGIAQLGVESNFTYLGPKDAETFLVQLWGNPPENGSDTLPPGRVVADFRGFVLRPLVEVGRTRIKLLNLGMVVKKVGKQRRSMRNLPER